MMHQRARGFGRAFRLAEKDWVRLGIHDEGVLIYSADHPMKDWHRAATVGNAAAYAAAAYALELPWWAGALLGAGLAALVPLHGDGRAGPLALLVAPGDALAKAERTARHGR